MQLDFDAEPPLEVRDCVVSGFFASRGLWAHQHVTQEMVDVSRAALEEVGASRLIGRSMASLSTGEARRVLLSPDGEHIAVTMPRDDRSVLVVLKVADQGVVGRRDYGQTYYFPPVTSGIGRRSCQERGG